ncbi:hypothetical protein LEN26_019870 [Aphanomyces euteiches]|nr:hypothetical protein LEN26_019870 [Aphanomyces euteiches]KAH9113198.1 hypothetical protein AeMF1_012570 [Aphanomyces euteiches]
MQFTTPVHQPPLHFHRERESNMKRSLITLLVITASTWVAAQNDTTPEPTQPPTTAVVTPAPTPAPTPPPTTTATPPPPTTTPKPTDPPQTTRTTSAPVTTAPITTTASPTTKAPDTPVVTTSTPATTAPVTTSKATTPTVTTTTPTTTSSVATPAPTPSPTQSTSSSNPQSSDSPLTATPSSSVPTTTASSASNSSDSSSSNTTTIVVAIVGGVAGVLLIAIAVVLFCRRRAADEDDVISPQKGQPYMITPNEQRYPPSTSAEQRTSPGGPYFSPAKDNYSQPNPHYQQPSRTSPPKYANDGFVSNAQRLSSPPFIASGDIEYADGESISDSAMSSQHNSNLWVSAMESVRTESTFKHDIAATNTGRHSSLWDDDDSNARDSASYRSDSFISGSHPDSFTDQDHALHIGTPTPGSRNNSITL